MATVPQTILCPDCHHYFLLKDADVEMLAESLKRNPSLQILCTPCGMKIGYGYWLKKQLKKRWLYTENKSESVKMPQISTNNCGYLVI